MTPSDGLVSLRAAPRVASPGKPPLLILLHGFGADEKDLMSLSQHFDPHFAVRSVRAPLALPQGGYAWFPFPATTSTGRSVDTSKAEAARQALQKFIAEAVATERADPDRVYLVGFSQGGVMALAIGLTTPDKVAGVVAMSSRILPEFDDKQAAPDALKGLPILVVHGTMDQMLPINHGRASRERLSALPVAFTYQEFPMRHEITQASLEVVSNWLGARLQEPRRLPPGASSGP